MNYVKLYRSDDVQKSAKLICELAKTCWDLKLSDSSGFSISLLLNDNLVLTDRTGTGFRRNNIKPKDLILVDVNGDFIFNPNKKDKRKAPVNVVIHLEGYKKSDARACIHWHDPFVNAFTIDALGIPARTLQSKLIGEVPCITIDDRKEKKALEKSGKKIVVPTGLHVREDVYFVMKKVGQEVASVLHERNKEFKRHGIVVTHFEHGLFSFGRNIEEAFDNGYRTVRNAQTIIYNKLLKS